MQYPVPQFTDVEDKIIAGLTLKQFGIIFGASVIIFLFYSTTKNLAFTIGLFVLVGIPALIVAFARINGRPLYVTFGHLIKFFLNPKEMRFHKSGLLENNQMVVTDLNAGEAIIPPTSQQSGVRLKELNYALQQQRQEESDLAKKQ